MAIALYSVFSGNAVFYTLLLSIVFSVKAFSAYTGHGQALNSGACFQQRVNQLVFYYTWPTATVPTIVVRILSQKESQKQAVQAASISLPFLDESPILLINHNEMSKYSREIQDFVLAHEIAHYHQACTNYMPLELVKKYILMQRTRVTTPDHRTGSRFYELPHTWLTIPVFKLYLSRCIELDADRRAVRALKTCTGGTKFFDYWINQTSATKGPRRLETLKACFNTHPTDYARKKNLEKTK